MYKKKKKKLLFHHYISQSFQSLHHIYCNENGYHVINDKDMENVKLK